MDAKTNNAGNQHRRPRGMVIHAHRSDAPRELVWEAMTTRKQVVNWWGPERLYQYLEKMDFRVGALWKT